MSSTQSTKYHCDNCGKTLKNCDNNLEIVTYKDDSSYHWSRLRVKIEYSHGCHNDGETDDADLCKKCALLLLNDAIKRIEKGERATAGAESCDQKGWV